jgi:pimeloyl-ACP methyl ester carboxylesterase
MENNSGEAVQNEPQMSQQNWLSSFKWKWFLSRCLILSGVMAIAVWIFFSPLNRVLFNFILFHPEASGSYDVKELAGCKVKNVYFKASDGNKLHGWFIENPKARYTALLSHGNCGNLTGRTDLICLLLDSGVTIFAYDYEGYGRSEGQISMERACDDAQCAYKYLINAKKIDPDTIILCGESLGTGITGNLSSKVKSKGIILQCPFISLYQRATEILPIERLYPISTYPEGGLDNGSVFTKKHAPLLIIGGVTDRVIPIHHADELFNLALEPKTYIRIDGAGHSGDPKLVRSVEYIQGLKRFFTTIDTK